MSRDNRKTIALLARLARARNLDSIVNQLPENTRHGIGAAINRSHAARMFDKLDKDKNKLISSDELKGHVIFKQVNWDTTAGLSRTDFIHQFAALRRGAYSDAVVSGSEAVASGPVSMYQYMLLSLKVRSRPPSLSPSNPPFLPPSSAPHPETQLINILRSFLPHERSRS